MILRALRRRKLAQAYAEQRALAHAVERFDFDFADPPMRWAIAHERALRRERMRAQGIAGHGPAWGRV